MTTQQLDGYRLSPQQLRLHRLRGERAAAVGVALLEGACDPERLRAALTRVIERHEILRTEFVALPGMETPMQRVSAKATFGWELDDRAGATVDAVCDELLAERSARDGGPPLRAHLVRLAERAWALSLRLPALCADLPTLERILAELSACYAGRPVDDEPLQYADFAEWQHAALEEPEADYWRRLAVPSSRLALRLTEAIPSGNAPVTGTSRGVPGPLAQAIASYLQQHALSEEALWLAAWACFARRSVFEDAFTIHRRSAARSAPPLDTAMGPIERYVPTFASLRPAARFAEIAADVQLALAEHEGHQAHFDASLLERPGEHEAPTFAFAYSTLAAHDAGEWSARWLTRRLDGEPLGLELEVTRSAAAQTLELRSADPLLSRNAVDRLLDGLLALVEEAITEPARPLCRLDAMGRDEHALLRAWSGPTDSAPVLRRSLPELVAATAANDPERPALVQSAAAMSYGELDRWQRRVAGALLARGVGADQVIALVSERSSLAIAGLLGVVAAGAAYAPLDPRAPRRRLAALLQQLGDGPVLTTRNVSDVLHGLGVSPERLLILEDLPPADAPIATPQPERAAYVIYTSGSTGHPKGVVVTHKGLDNLAAALEACVYHGLPAPARVSLDAPLYFDASIKQLVALGAGHTLLLVPEELRADGEGLLGYLRATPLDVFDATPAQLELLLQAGLERAPRALPARVVLGGEALLAATWDRLRAIGGERFYNVYGPTECTDVTTVARLDSSPSPTLGRALPNTRVHVLDEWGNLAAIGAAGELTISGLGVARGYLHQPALTAERFVPATHQARPGERCYRTGDRARWTERGELEFLGRLDHQVKLRGYRIELGEIEAVLRQCPGVRDGVVLLREDRPGDPRLVAYVVPTMDQAPSDEQLARALAEQLPAYMVPSAFVHLERLPLSRNGKVHRAALPAPASSTPTALPAHSPLEGVLWSIWSELLGASVGLEDDFFARGGHSLLATALVARVRDALSLELPLRLVFEAPTIRGLARRIEEQRSAASARPPLPPLTPVARDGALPLSFAQQRIWLAQHMDPADTSYNAPSAFAIDGPLAPELLERALTLLVERHEPLRTTFELRGDAPVQRIHRPTPQSVSCTDLRAHGAEPDVELDRRLQALAALPFDLERGPLFRVELFRVGPARHVLAFDMHHVIRDAWSTAIFVRELVEVYRALAEGRRAQLPPLALQYADYAHWQRRTFTEERYRDHLEHWRRRLAGDLPITELPLDRPREQRRTNTGRRHIAALPAELGSALRALSQRAGVTLFMTTLAGFLVQLHRLRDQRELTIGMAIAGRDRLETEHLFGCMINMLVLRFDLGETTTFSELLRQVRQVTLEAYDHQEMPFDQLVKELAPPRRPGVSPLFQVAFGLQTTSADDLVLPGLELHLLPAEAEAVRYDLTLWVNEERSDGRLTVDWTYSDELFDGRTIANLAASYQTLLSEIAANPEGSLHSYRLLDEQEQQAQAAAHAARQQGLSRRLSSMRRKAEP